MEFAEIYKNLVHRQNEERFKLLEKHLREINFLSFSENDILQQIGTKSKFLVINWEMGNEYPLHGGLPTAYYLGYDLKENGELDRSRVKRLDVALAKKRYIKVEVDGSLGTGYTYLLRVMNTNFYKIGMAMDVEARVASLQMGSPFDITIIAIKENLNPRQLERSLHLQFKHKRKRGEWFEFHECEVDRIIEEYFS